MPRKQPTLEDLISRVVRLEAENTILKERIADLVDGSEIYGATMLHEFAVIQNALWPVVDKVFPGYTKMQARIEKVIPRCWADPRADRKRKLKTD